MATWPRATLTDLMRTEGQAELIGGMIVVRPLAGLRPSLIAGRIYRSLADHIDASGRGVALSATVAYVVSPLPSGRESFCADVSFSDGPIPGDPMQFISGPPTLAVEVRGADDDGPAAERDMAAKRADYFAAGTAIVWDVDPVAVRIRAYRPDAPDQPVIFDRGQVADAEPILTGWRLAVDRIAP